MDTLLLCLLYTLLLVTSPVWLGLAIGIVVFVGMFSLALLLQLTGN